MFTGLIETTGTVLAVTPPADSVGPTRITIAAPSLAPRLRIGDSVAVSGVCLTALDISQTTFSADLAEETVARTTLTKLGRGAIVNLELPTPSGSPLGGHVVQGHVDGVGTLEALEAVNPQDKAGSDWRLRFRVPSHLSRYIAPQGSITVDGISLTVAHIVGDVVAVNIIPHTYAVTTVHTLRPGSPINIEVDVLAKYAERQGTQAAPARRPVWTVTEEYLISNGY
jgi:riboflavin synthase